MNKEIRVPALGESVTEATIAKWFKNVGDTVKADEPKIRIFLFFMLVFSLAAVELSRRVRSRQHEIVGHFAAFLC